MKSSYKSSKPRGGLVHKNSNNERCKISIINYGSESYSYKEYDTVEEVLPAKSTDIKSWINIDGLGDLEVIDKVASHFNLHQLLVDDVLNTDHRPKVDEFDDAIFITLKMIGIAPEGKGVVSEQVSFVLGSSWLISFQEQEGDLFDGIRKRLKELNRTVKNKSIDFLLYQLIDTIVDNYFEVSEFFNESIEDLEEDVIRTASKEALEELQQLKRQIITFRRSVNPLRDAISSLQKNESPLIQSGTNIYLSDVYEHLIHLSENIDFQRDMISSTMDLYLSGVSYKMNQVMQVLTIMSVIFIPLTFIAGIYGMNFDNIPELHHKYGYYFVWFVMIVITIVMLLYFKKKKWL